MHVLLALLYSRSKVKVKVKVILLAQLVKLLITGSTNIHCYTNDLAACVYNTGPVRDSILPLAVHTSTAEMHSEHGHLVAVPRVQVEDASFAGEVQLQRVPQLGSCEEAEQMAS